jgi:hypothetical protein
VKEIEMNSTPRSILRDRFIRGAIVAASRGNHLHSAHAMALAIQHNRAFVVETARNDNPASVTCPGMDSMHNPAAASPRLA